MSEELKVRAIRDKISEREIERIKADGMKYKRNGEEEYKETMWELNKEDDLFFYDEARCDSFKNVLKLLSEIGERYCKEHDKHPESVLLNQSIVVINVIKEKIKELERKFKP